MPRTLIFDLGRVLITIDFSIAHARMAAATGLAPEQIGARLDASGLMIPYEKGLVSSHDFATGILKALDANITHEEFHSIWNSIFDGGALMPESIIADLHKRYRLVLLSNTNEVHFDYLRDTLPSLRHFDAITVSHEAKAMKPEPAIYLDALSKANAAPEECFYSDDIAEYVAGARACGIQAVQFTGVEQWLTDARAAGIEI